MINDLEVKISGNRSETTKEKSVRLILTLLNWGYTVKNCNNENDLNIKVQKRLKLQNNYDPIRMRSCIDLIEDTENAILYFCEFGLEKFDCKSMDNIGEMYLKLYGILNAI